VPVVYEIDRVNKIIHTRCVGPVTLEEVVDHFRTLVQDPDCPECLDVLLDLSEETSIPTKQELEEVTRALRTARRSVHFGFCAIVAVRDALFGMARMWEVFAEHYFDGTYVFRSMKEAEVWLASHHSCSTAQTRFGAPGDV
jgi:hypothetical protein